MINDVEQFAREYIYADEAAQILGIDVLTLYKWVRQQRVQPVLGGADNVSGLHRYLFRRSSIEELASSTLLTGPQLAKIMGVHRSHVHRLVRSGQIHPVSGPGVDNSGHYQFSPPEP